MAAGFFRGWTDTIISRLLDLIWAYPALLLGVALGVSLAVGGLNIGPIHIQGGSHLLAGARDRRRLHPLRRATDAR